MRNLICSILALAACVSCGQPALEKEFVNAVWQDGGARSPAAKKPAKKPSLAGATLDAAKPLPRDIVLLGQQFEPECSRLGLLSQPEAQIALKMTAQQVEATEILMTKFRNRRLSRGQTDDETEKALAQVLSAEQNAIVDKLMLIKKGFLLFEDEKILAGLAISDTPVGRAKVSKRQAIAKAVAEGKSQLAAATKAMNEELTEILRYLPRDSDGNFDAVKLAETKQSLLDSYLASARQIHSSTWQTIKTHLTPQQCRVFRRHLGLP